MLSLFSVAVLSHADSVDVEKFDDLNFDITGATNPAANTENQTLPGISGDYIVWEDEISTE